MSSIRPPSVRAYSCRPSHDGGGEAHAIRAPLAYVYVQRFRRYASARSKHARARVCVDIYVLAMHASTHVRASAVMWLCTCTCAHIQAMHPRTMKIQARRRTSLHPLLQQLHAIKLMTYHDDAAEEVRGDSSDTNHASAIMMTPRRVRHRQGERRRRAWLIFQSCCTGSWTDEALTPTPPTSTPTPRMEK